MRGRITMTEEELTNEVEPQVAEAEDIDIDNLELFRKHLDNYRYRRPAS